MIPGGISGPSGQISIQLDPAGPWFHPGDPASLATALAAVLDDDGHRRHLGRRNHAAATSLPLAEVCDWHIGRALELAA